ncbi:MAG: hypothetical protein ACRD0Z_17325 [Acidimicrobiales bacterium]
MPSPAGQPSDRGSRTGPPRQARPSRADVDEQILRLRDGGSSYSSVASKLGLPRAVDAQAGFIRALKRRPEDQQVDLTGREAARLDTLEARVRSRDAEDPEKMNRRLVALERLRDALK